MSAPAARAKRVREAEMAAMRPGIYLQRHSRAALRNQRGARR